MRFNHFDCCESPARSTRSLVFNRRHFSQWAPVEFTRQGINHFVRD